MDGKAKIRLDSTEEELVDISIGFSAACSIFMVLAKGIDLVNQDISEMKSYIANIKSSNPMFDELNRVDKEVLVKKTTDQLGVAQLGLIQSQAFQKELMRVIKELEPQREKKVIIHKPKWP